MSIDFARQLIKGKIAELVFEQMIRDEKMYTVIPFGYEHTVPTLAQYHGIVEVQKVIDDIKNAPDFALVSEDKTKLYLVEVKYQSQLNIELLKEYAKELLDRWEYPWIFVATSENFYCGMCKDVLTKNKINNLSENWVSFERQKHYLKLLKEFEK